MSCEWDDETEVKEGAHNLSGAKPQIYSLLILESDVFQESTVHCLAVHFIVCIDDEWQHWTPQNVVIITIYTLICGCSGPVTFLFSCSFSFLDLIFSIQNYPGPRHELRIGAQAPILSPLKTTAGAGSKRDRGRGRPGWWMLSPPSPAPCKAICYGVVTVK